MTPEPLNEPLNTTRKATIWHRWHNKTDKSDAGYFFNHISDGWIEAAIPPESAFVKTDYSDWQKEYGYLTPIPENKLIKRAERA